MTLPGFELGVFDCDGVLVDSEVIAVRVDELVHAEPQPETPGATVIHDMRRLPALPAAGRP